MANTTRRNFLKYAGLTALAAAIPLGCKDSVQIKKREDNVAPHQKETSGKNLDNLLDNEDLLKLQNEETSRTVAITPDLKVENIERLKAIYSLSKERKKEKHFEKSFEYELTIRGKKVNAIVYENLIMYCIGNLENPAVKYCPSRSEIEIRDRSGYLNIDGEQKKELEKTATEIILGIYSREKVIAEKRIKNYIEKSSLKN